MIEIGDGEILVHEGGAPRRLDLRTLAPDDRGDVLVGEGYFDPPTTPLDDDGQGMPYATYAFGAQMAEVEVDLDLGKIIVRRIVAAHDVGKAINPIQVEGQIHGGIAQGIGFALMEEFVPGRTENLHDYLIPTFGDVPPIETILIEDPEPLGPFGAKGIGEPALIPTAPAILGGVHHATGVRLRFLPATPHRVREAILAARRNQRPRRWLRHAETRAEGIVTCDACPVLCRIRPGRSGACDRYGNVGGVLTRLDPFVVTQKVAEKDGKVVPFGKQAWEGSLVSGAPVFVTGIGSGTTYPDYKPAPFIVSSQYDGVDMVTVVSEGIFSYCGLKVKIDTDRYIGPETAAVRVEGEQVGHVTTAEYGSQMLALGGVRHLTGGSKQEGNVTCATMLKLCGGEAVDMAVDGGAQMTIRAGAPPVINGNQEERMRVGCGSATIGIFAKQWYGEADEVIVVDDHITGVLTEHQAGRFLEHEARRGSACAGASPRRGAISRWRSRGPAGAAPTSSTRSPSSRRSTRRRRGRDCACSWSARPARMRRSSCSTRRSEPVPAEMPSRLRQVVDRIGENCEPALCTVMFMAGAGGSLRAGITENPVRLTRSVKQALTRVTCGGAPVYVWPGGGITFMVDVTTMPENSFGYVPTPALVAPIEFTLRLDDYAAMGGHVAAIRRIEDIAGIDRLKTDRVARPGAVARRAARARADGGMSEGRIGAPPVAAVLPDGRRRHFQHGPIDLVLEAFGERSEVEAAYDQAWDRFRTVLDELVAELPALRTPLGEGRVPVTGPVARAMVRACAPHRPTLHNTHGGGGRRRGGCGIGRDDEEPAAGQGLRQQRRRHRALSCARANVDHGSRHARGAAVARRVLPDRGGIARSGASPPAGGAAAASRWGSRIP